MPNPRRDTTAGRIFNDVRNLAKRDGRSTDELLVLYVLERFLYRLSISSHWDKLILKGGLLLAVLDARRATRDADLLARWLDSDTSTVVALVAEIAAIEVDDGVVFDPASARTAPIREDDRYAGVRVVVPAAVGKAKVKLALDINFGDPVTPGPVPTPFPQLLDAGTFPLLGYPIHTVLAEKITTMIALGDLNTRDRDWADVWRLIHTHDLDANGIRTALTTTARHRDVTLKPLSDVVVRLPQLRQQSYAVWRARQNADAHLYPHAFADIVDTIIRFADPALTDSLADRTWSSVNSRWE